MADVCRFAVYLGEAIRISSLVTEPVHSILHQSFHSHEREEPLNGDGFGIAWYVPGSPEPALLKEVSPAWNSINLQSVARVTGTTCLLAHVRAATPGLPVHQFNCHPFTWRELSFMHNGTVGGFLDIKQALVGSLARSTYRDLRGSTDSEHLFALIREAWIEAEGAQPLVRLETAMRNGIERVEAMRVAAGIDEPSLLNLVLSDGRCCVVSRFVSDPGTPSHTLYVHSGGRYECDDGTCVMIKPTPGLGAVIVASEPLSEDPGWKPVPENHLVRVGEKLAVDLVPLDPVAQVS